MVTIRHHCWTCKHFVYMAASHRTGWCTFGPPIRDVQKDAAIASVTCHPVVMFDTDCGRWETNEQTMAKVRKEEEAQELQDAYNTLACEDATRETLKRITLASYQERKVAREELERRVQQREDRVNKAKETIGRLGPNPFMETTANKQE